MVIFFQNGWKASLGMDEDVQGERKEVIILSLESVKCTKMHGKMSCTVYLMDIMNVFKCILFMQGQSVLVYICTPCFDLMHF